MEARRSAAQVGPASGVAKHQDSDLGDSGFPIPSVLLLAKEQDSSLCCRGAEPIVKRASVNLLTPGESQVNRVITPELKGSRCCQILPTGSTTRFFCIGLF